MIFDRTFLRTNELFPLFFISEKLFVVYFVKLLSCKLYIKEGLVICCLLSLQGSSLVSKVSEVDDFLRKKIYTELIITLFSILSGFSCFMNDDVLSNWLG
jgi:hypothetical protein